MPKNCYQILEVDPDCELSEFEEILKKAYKNIKPEVNSDLAQQAFTILNDPQQRQIYDKLLRQKGHAHAVSELQKMQTQPLPSRSKTLFQMLTPKAKKQFSSASQKNLYLTPHQVLEISSIPRQLSYLNKLDSQAFAKLKDDLGIGKTAISAWISPTKEQYKKHQNYSKTLSVIDIVSTREKFNNIVEYLKYDESSKIQCIFNLLIDPKSNFEEIIETLNPEIQNAVLLDIMMHNKVYSDFNSKNFTTIIVSLLKQLHTNNITSYLATAPLFESYTENKLFILGLVYCDSSVRFAILLRHISRFSNDHLPAVIQTIKEQLDQIDGIDNKDLYSDLKLLLKFNKGSSEEWMNYLNPHNHQAWKLSLWILNCDEINRIHQFNLQFSAVNRENNIAVLLNHLNSEKSKLSELSEFNTNFNLVNITKVIRELQIINKTEIYTKRFSALSLPQQKQFFLSLIYSLNANTNRYQMSLKYQKDITDFTQLQTVMETHFQHYLTNPKYKPHCDSLKEIITKQKKVLAQNAPLQPSSDNPYQSQTKHLRKKNIEQITTAFSDYISWMNQNTNSSLLYRLFWAGHIFHGKTGKVRAETALAKIKGLNPEREYQNIKAIVKQAYHSSGHCKHSLRRFLFAGLNNDVKNGFENSATVKLSDAAFKKEDQVKNILGKPTL